MRLETAFQGVTKVFLDTAPVIYYIEATVAYAELVQGIFQRFASQQVQAVTSPVTLAECLIVPVRLGQLQRQQDFIEFLTNTEEIYFMPINAEVGKRSAEMRSRYNLKLPDALQMATALEAGCDAFLTNDVALKRVAELKVLTIAELENV